MSSTVVGLGDHFENRNRSNWFGKKKLVDVRERAARSVFQLVSSFLPVDPAGNTEHEVLFIPSSWDGRLKK